MNKIMDFMGYEVIQFAGFFKIMHNGKRVGGLYSTKEEAHEACIEYKRDELGIKILSSEQKGDAVCQN